VMSRFLIRVGQGPGGLDFFIAVAMEHPAVDVVGVATDMSGAVDLVAREKPDVMVLDLDAVADSSDAVRRLRTASPETRVMMVSGRDNPETAAVALAAGADSFMERTLRPELLVEQVAALVDGAIRSAAAHLTPTDQSGARRARRLATGVTRLTGQEQLVDPVNLLVSELVGNAVRHTDSDIEVVIHVLAELLRVEVRDGSAVPPAQRTPDPTDVSGRGLALVDAVASRWGVDPLPQGKSVWFELALSSS
jgi:CheY-like chemotaxis protein